MGIKALLLRKSSEEANSIKSFESLKKKLSVEGKNIFNAFYQNKLDGHEHILYNIITQLTMRKEKSKGKQITKFSLTFFPSCFENIIIPTVLNISDADDIHFSSLERQIQH
jgi:hypothetical protein